jgi:hypothetical protein
MSHQYLSILLGQLAQSPLGCLLGLLGLGCLLNLLGL